MIESVETYLTELKKELTGCDPAIIQDALSDAEEHLRNALEQVPLSEMQDSEAEALIPIVDKYGSPSEIAAAYRDIETRTPPALASRKPSAGMSPIVQYLAIVWDASAWGALLYLVFSLVTGLVYFTWIVAGLSLSLSLMILVIGLPFTALFLMAVRSIALVEGRIVEAMLGVRMPRRPFFTNRSAGWWAQAKNLFLEKRTWTAMAYMVFQLPLGLLYFSVFTILLALSLSLILNPVLVHFMDAPLIQFAGEAYYLTPRLMPIFVIVGFNVLLVTMHLAKWIGRQHGKMAKTLLVGERGANEISEMRTQNRDSRIMEDSMDRKEIDNANIEGRPPLLVLIISIAVFAAVLGITLFAFLLSS